MGAKQSKNQKHVNIKARSKRDQAGTGDTNTKQISKKTKNWQAKSVETRKERREQKQRKKETPPQKKTIY